MGSCLVRWMIALLLAVAVPAWTAAAELSAADRSNCCGESCPAGGEGTDGGCTSCCSHALWVNPGVVPQAVGGGQAHACAQPVLAPQVFYSPPERPPRSA